MERNQADKVIRQIKARINRDIKKIIESEEDFYKPAREGNFWSFGAINISNMKVMVIEIKHCQLKNILIKLNHT